MPEPGRRTEPAAVLRRLQDATNAHDIEAICACFAPGYRNETPVHPARGFTGGLINSARFYLEPVDEGGSDVNAAVQGQVSPRTAS